MGACLPRHAPARVSPRVRHGRARRRFTTIGGFAQQRFAQATMQNNRAGAR
jgi:hypothetical protein